MAQEESMLEALKKSLDFEREGTEFYIELGINAQHPLARNLFYNLAKQEIDHMVRIEEILTAAKSEAPWPPVPEGKIGEIEHQMRSVFEKLDEKARKEELDNIEGYRLAIDMEREGYAMYKEFSEKATEEREKQFFLELTGEERKHLEALDNVYYYLTQSKDWLSVEESKIWNWMST